MCWAQALEIAAASGDEQDMVNDADVVASACRGEGSAPSSTDMVVDSLFTTVESLGTAPGSSDRSPESATEVDSG